MSLKITSASQAKPIAALFMPRRTDETTPEAIGERLRFSREVLGHTQREFAKRAGISVTAYNQYETGTTKPRVENAIRLREEYNLTLDWIYCGDPSGLPDQLAQGIKHLRQARHR
jgi:transcriptional regulator with XRE-family HTH domain